MGRMCTAYRWLAASCRYLDDEVSHAVPFVAQLTLEVRDLWPD